jgi:excisionase family DNA binding protein
MDSVETTRSSVNRDRKAAAEYIGVSLITLDRALRDGEIGHYRIGRRILFSEEHLNDFLALNEQPPADRKRRS